MEQLFFSSVFFTFLKINDNTLDYSASVFTSSV